MWWINEDIFEDRIDYPAFEIALKKELYDIERLNLRSSAVSSEENLEGKLFVQFVALINLAYFGIRMHEKGLYRNYTLQELLDELDIFECFEHPVKQGHPGEMTKKQRELYQLFGMVPGIGIILREIRNKGKSDVKH